MNTKLTAALAAKYFGCKVAQFINNEDAVVGAMVGIVGFNCVIALPENTVSEHPLSKSKLVLKPLKRISDEDAIEVAKILQDNSEEGLFDMDDFQGWMDDIFTGNCATYSDYVSGNKMKEVIDYLRSKGYDIDGGIKDGWAIEEKEGV